DLAGGGTIAGYYVQVATDSGFTKVVQDYRPTTTSQLVTGLTSNVPYYFRTMATNGASWGAFSATAVRLVTPSSPTNVVVPPAPSTNTSVALSWTAPANTGGGPITGYIVQVATDSGFTKIVQEYKPTTATQTVTGLTPNVAYYFRVMASNGVYSGPNSATAARLVPPSAPKALTVPLAPSTNTTVALSWTAPSDGGGGPITGYYVQVATDAGFSKLFQDYRPTTTAQNVTGLTPNVAYYFRVMASNGASWGPNSATAVRVVPPSAPTALTVPPGLGTETSVNLTWSAPADTGGGSITGYTVQVATAAAFTTVVQEFTPTTTAQTVTGLTANVPYYFRVRAINAASPGPFSVTAVRLVPPSAPTAVKTAAGLTAGSVAVSWTAPTNTGGASAITGYFLQTSEDSNFATFDQVWVTGTSTTVSGLTSKKTYFFRVMASNGVQSGAPSTAASRTV
ncbi:MAG: fibronectin type III domain-containing protein, partial [Planctomycetia bacterium]|nr:fibronectin type III domain-containing protein [Planctomycetia bacterium]